MSVFSCALRCAEEVEGNGNIGAGITLVEVPVSIQRHFMRQDDLLLRSKNFLGIGLMVKLPTVFQRAK